MSGATVLLLLGLLAVGGASPSARIVGGAVTSINQYPFTVSVLTLINNNWMQVCGGSILNNRSFLCAAHCFIYRPAANLRGRVGSTNAHSGGVVHNFAFYVNHPHYNEITVDNDIAVARVSSAFGFNNNVRAVSIAGPNYNLADGQSVWAAGWGLMSRGGQPSEQLRHVQIWTVNQETCRQRFSNITPNMVCAAWLGVGGRGVCSRDSGGPLVHNGVLVGVTSFSSADCGSATHPSVFARVSRYTSWIQQNS